jgi:CDP-diacylglycerol--serine O-phosphatidyltransferase
MPCLPVMAEKVRGWRARSTYRETLLALIAQAKQRILIAALYLQDDDAGREVLEALYAPRRRSRSWKSPSSSTGTAPSAA